VALSVSTAAGGGYVRSVVGEAEVDVLAEVPKNDQHTLVGERRELAL
jgi:hypothetical protein